MNWKINDKILDLYQVLPIFNELEEGKPEKKYHQGGFGKVFRIYHPNWQRDMALKMPLEGKFLTQKQKDGFKAECETWINIGLHPHICTCHYVREIDGVPGIFSEYADAGTLADWIRTDYLYKSGKEQALKIILDLAIQFAWGLHYAHERDIIHQDVKPVNALMWKDGTLKITDFGLVRARQKAGIDDPNTTLKTDHTLMITSGGMTPAYCSPEQAAGDKLSRRTDIWSWAICVMEMFAGEVPFLQSGVAAAEALKQLKENNPAAENDMLPEMPENVYQLLQQCFSYQADERPKNLIVCAEALIDIYKNQTGEPYPRTLPTEVGDTADALNNKALSLIDLGESEKAERVFKEALQKDPHHVAATYNMGLVTWRAAKKTDTEIKLVLEEVGKTLKQNANLQLALGWINMESANFKEASICFKSFLELKDDRIIRKTEKTASLLTNENKGGCINTFKEHTHFVEAVAVSPNGLFAVSVGWDNSLKIWDIPNCKIRKNISLRKKTVTSFVWSVCISPDNSYVVLGNGDNSITIWDIELSYYIRVLEGHKNSVRSVAISPDGKFILSGSDDKTVKYWDIKTGECLLTLEGHEKGVNTVVFSPDGDNAISCGKDHLKLWNLKSGKFIDNFNCLGGYYYDVAIPFIGNELIAAKYDRMVVCDLKTISERPNRDSKFEGHIESVTSVSITPDGKYIVSGSADCTVRIWDMATGRCLRTFEGHNMGVKCVSIHPEGNLAFSSSSDKSIKMWDILSVFKNKYIAPYLYSPPTNLELERKNVDEYNFHIIQAEKSFKTGNIKIALEHFNKAYSIPGYFEKDKSIEVLSKLRPYLIIKRFKRGWLKMGFKPDLALVNSAKISSDNRFAFTANFFENYHTVKKWDLQSDECVKTYGDYGYGHNNHVNCVAIPPCESIILSGSNDNTLVVWDEKTAKYSKILHGHDGDVLSVAISPNAVYGLSGSEDKTIKLWELSSGQCINTMRGHDSDVKTVLFTPDSKHALSGSIDNTIKLWDLLTGECIHTYKGHKCSVNSIAATSDGKNFISGSGSMDGTIKLWEIRSGKCLQTFERHCSDVESIAIFPNNKYFASAGRDKKVKLWEIETGKCLRVFEGHKESINTLAVSNDSTFILSGSHGELFTWFLEWEYEFTGWTDWDKRVLPFLENFYFSYQQKWEDNINILIENLSNSGLGHVKHDKIIEKLYEMQQNRMF